MFFTVVVGWRLLLVIDDEVDLALAPEVHVFGSVPGNVGEPQRCKNRFQNPTFSGGIFYKFKAVQAHRVFEEISHRQMPRQFFNSRGNDIDNKEALLFYNC